METRLKKRYSSPVTEVIELRTEGVLCMSGNVESTMSVGAYENPFGTTEVWL